MFLVLIALACTPPQSTPTAAPALRLVVLGDRTDEADDAAWGRSIDAANALRPDLVLSVGDLVDEPYNPAEWARVHASLARLRAPVALAPGNHDLVDEASVAVFTRETGQPPYRAFDQAGVHVVLVDNSRAERWEDLDAAQRAWLEADLPAHAGAPIVVVMHKPFWATRIAVGAADPMHELFVRAGVVAVFTGHWHTHLAATVDGVAYIGVGSSGGVTMGLPDARLGNTFEVVEATLRGRTVEARSVVDGQGWPVDRVTPRDSGRIRRVLQGAMGARVSGEAVEVHVENVTDAPLHTELTLAPGGWTVEATRWTVDLAPGELFRASAPASPTGDGLPLPRLSATWPLSDAGPVPIAVVADHARELWVPRGAAPTLDGVIDAAEWAGAARVDRFVTDEGVAARGDPTVVYVRRDAEALYVAARCDDTEPSALTRVHTDRDGNVVFDDRVGLLLAPAPDQLYWAYVNPNGAVWDLHADRAAHVVDKAWNAVEARATVDATGWSAELRIPFAALGGATSVDGWGFDLRRRNNREQSEALFTPGFSYTRPERMGVLRE